MPHSEQPDEDCGRDGGSVPEPPRSRAGISPKDPDPPERIESWDPVDDQMESAVRRQVQWNWHGRPSWGRKAVAVFPLVAVVLAVGLIVHTTVEAQGAIDQVQSVLGTGGAVVKALPLLGPDPFFHVNADTLWIDGVRPNLARLAETFAGRFELRRTRPRDSPRGRR